MLGLYASFQTNAFSRAPLPITITRMKRPPNIFKLQGTEPPGLHESFDNRITRKKGDVLRPMFCTYNGIKGPPLGLHTAVAELLVQEIQRLFIVDAYLV